MIKFLKRLFKFKEKKRIPEKHKNGKWKEFNKNAILINEGHYVEGLRDGLWRFYYDSGELLIEEEYQQGKKHGKYNSYFRSGDLMSQGKFSNDLRQGEFKVFNEQGRVIKILIFKNDELMDEISSSHASSTSQEQIKYDMPVLIAFFSYILYLGIN